MSPTLEALLGTLHGRRACNALFICSSTKSWRRPSTLSPQMKHCRLADQTCVLTCCHCIPAFNEECYRTCPSTDMIQRCPSLYGCLLLGYSIEILTMFWRQPRFRSLPSNRSQTSQNDLSLQNLLRPMWRLAWALGIVGFTLQSLVAWPS